MTGSFALPSVSNGDKVSQLIEDTKFFTICGQEHILQIEQSLDGGYNVRLGRVTEPDGDIEAMFFQDYLERDAHVATADYYAHFEALTEQVKERNGKGTAHAMFVASSWQPPHQT